MTVVVAVGEERRSGEIVRHGHELAAALYTELVVVHVIPDDEAEKHVQALNRIPEFQDLSFEHERERAAEFAAKVLDESLGTVDADVRTVGRTGDPSDEVRSVAELEGARYVVIGGRKRSPIGKAVFGSTTQDILLGSSTPVVVVPLAED